MARQLYIICSSGAHEKMQMAAMTASIGAASGDEVTVFLSMNALPYFVKGNESAAPAEGEFGAMLSKQGVPPFRDLFRMAAELGDVKLLPCSMAMDLLEVTQDDMDPALGPATGLTVILSDAEKGQLLSF